MWLTRRCRYSLIEMFERCIDNDSTIFGNFFEKISFETFEISGIIVHAFEEGKRETKNFLKETFGVQIHV